MTLGPLRGPWRNFEYRDVPGVVAFWQRRAVEAATGERRIWYATPDPFHRTEPRKSINGKPPDSLTDRCLHVSDDIIWELLRGRGSRRCDELIWTEGETDAEAVDSEGALALTHHGGAGASTQLQAARLRHFRGRVFVAADRDDAGMNCAARRAIPLHGVGIPWKRIEVIAARSTVAGADLRDHIERHELALSEAADVDWGDLRAAVERFRARASTSAPGTSGLAGPAEAFYHGGRLSLTDAEWEQFYNSRWNRSA